MMEVWLVFKKYSPADRYEGEPLAIFSSEKRAREYVEWKGMYSKSVIQKFILDEEVDKVPPQEGVGMTVKELILELETFDPTLPVAREAMEGEGSGVRIITWIEKTHGATGPWGRDEKDVVLLN